MSTIQNLVNDFRSVYTDTEFVQVDLPLLLLHKLTGSNATVANIVFSNSTNSAPFTIANRLVLIVVPAIIGAPTLTLQVSLDNGNNWTNTSIALVTDASISKTIEADTLAKVSGAFGLTNAFRFKSTSSINATLSVRSISQ